MVVGAAAAARATSAFATSSAAAAPTAAATPSSATAQTSRPQHFKDEVCGCHVAAGTKGEHILVVQRVLHALFCPSGVAEASAGHACRVKEEAQVA
jgi:hypothetical protein